MLIKILLEFFGVMTGTFLEHLALDGLESLRIRKAGRKEIDEIEL